MTEIKKTYLPESGYKYLIEEKLKGSEIDIQPDIQVIDETGHVICVVEIGYTRPEKMALYKELKIPDIRWYSKDGKFVNPHEHIQMTEVQVKYYYEFPKEEIWREVDLNEVSDLICRPCLEEYYIAKYSEKYHISEEQEDEIDYDNKDKQVSGQAYDEWFEQADIFGELWCNGARWFCVWLCDDCGDIGFMTGDQLKDSVLWHDFACDDAEIFSYDKFLKQHFKELNTPIETKSIIERIIRRPLYSDLKKKASFEELREYISDTYDYEIEYGQIGETPK
ncbi:MAG: hypothetical protein WCO26_19675 [Deltaproteobacteria bacterium]